MDFVIGLIFWGGLLLLVLTWISRTGLTGRRSSGGVPPARPAAPPPPIRPWTAAEPQARRADLQQLREDEALTDGLVIGHYLTRDHYRERIDGLEDHIEELTTERDHWSDAAAMGDDVDADLDYAEFDAMAGFGLEPWADDLFDPDDED
ncbi:MAG: hypothetical protein ACNA8R_10850 [Nitriliruptoraceae bacterium]